MKKETEKYIIQIKILNNRNMQDKILHMLHMELNDNMLVKNVNKITDTKVVFEYMGVAGNLMIKGYNVTMNYNNISRNVKSYKEVVNILCEG